MRHNFFKFTQDLLRHNFGLQSRTTTLDHWSVITSSRSRHLVRLGGVLKLPPIIFNSTFYLTFPFSQLFSFREYCYRYLLSRRYQKEVLGKSSCYIPVVLDCLSKSNIQCFCSFKSNFARLVPVNSIFFICGWFFSLVFSASLPPLVQLLVWSNFFLHLVTIHLSNFSHLWLSLVKLHSPLLPLVQLSSPLITIGQILHALGYHWSNFLCFWLPLVQLSLFWLPLFQLSLPFLWLP